MTETPQPAVIDSIANEHLTVEVSRLGAELHSIKSADSREWLWNGDPAWWNGRAPILFPIVGRAPDNTITIDGEAFPMAQHGFARKRIFTRAVTPPIRWPIRLPLMPKAGRSTRSTSF